MTSIRRRLLGLFFGFLLIFLVVMVSFLSKAKGDFSIVIGAKSDTEGHILSEIIAQFIESELLIPVQRNFSLDGTFINFNALKAKEIDLYVEYTGTALTAILKRNVVGIGQTEALEELRETFLKEFNIVWMDPLGFQNSYALMVTPETADKYGIKTLSDLKGSRTELRIGFDAEFYGRDEAKILEKDYGVSLQGIKVMDHSLLYLTLKKEGLELINGYSTDGLARGLIILEDDQNLLPFYDAVPIVHQETLKSFPELEGVLKKLKGKFSVEEVQEMNYAVEKNGESIHDVARSFLSRHEFFIHE